MRFILLLLSDFNFEDVISENRMIKPTSQSNSDCYNYIEAQYHNSIQKHAFWLLGLYEYLGLDDHVTLLVNQ